MKPITNIKQFILMRLAALVLVLSANSCMTMREKSYGSDGMPNENHAAKHKDFSAEEYKSSFKTDISMGYRVGDRFRTRQQMFLIYSNSGIVYLNQLADFESPHINKYLQNSGAYRYGGDNPYQVIKLVPAGTVIEIVKIAKYNSSPYPYFVISGANDWFRSAAFAEDEFPRDREGRVTAIKSYDMELFQKL
jgi:hypothetical protein